MTITFTPAEAQKKIRELNEELNAELRKENMSAVFIASINEDVDSCRPDYSFADAQYRIALINYKIRAIKHALNIFNTTTVLPGTDMTIDEVLVYLPQLNERIRKYNDLKGRLPKQRRNMYDKSGNVEYEYTNYQIRDAEDKYNKNNKTLHELQLLLDSVNCSARFDVDLSQ